MDRDTRATARSFPDLPDDPEGYSLAIQDQRAPAPATNRYPSAIHLQEPDLMLHAVWKGASLRSWIAVAMGVAVLPLAASGIAGYFYLSHGLVASFQDVARRQRDEIDPLQRLRLSLVDAETPLDDYVDEGDPRDIAVYRTTRGQVEAMFAQVHAHADSDPELRSLVERARDDWSTADRLGAEVLAVRRPAGDTHNAELMDQFHGLIGSSVDKLGVVYADLDKDLRADHDDALSDASRSDWLAGGAAIVSAIAILIGAIIIGRVMSASVERLVNGAELFAAGDRSHRIDISLPPELHRVAQEFNKMIGRIHESEDAVADLARRDPLTLLGNRRAFDEYLAEMQARQERLGETFALVALDLDHFKRINDTHGHIVGDEVLRVAAHTIGADLRPFDRAYRTGGEEFAVVFGGISITAAELAAERLREAIATHPAAVDGVVLPLTVSIGVALSSPGGSAAALIAAADAALYRAKEGGRNRVVV
ncbi:MAG TPA: diguanylate cyclase [Gemmatimonadales bacterium]|jgi:diguanylate cyclase (GGDEF)-like protein|nr:diguanylate cyclase [Gemmatimonadales bacterium]